MSNGLSLEAFNTIASGKFNVGEISLNSKGTGLAKVNNHVYRTSQNNVRLTADQNRLVRTALMAAFTERFTNDQVMLDAIREQLLGGGRDACSLNREYVRHLISSATKAANTSVGDGMKLAKDAGRMPLLDRRIKIADGKGGKPILQSSKAVAFEMETLEESNCFVLKAKEELSKFLKPNNLPEATAKDPLKATSEHHERIQNVSRAVKRATVDLLMTTSGWDETQAMAFGARLDKRIMNSGFCNDHARSFNRLSETDAKVEYLNDLKNALREVYKEFKVDDGVVDKHLKRIFPENA